MTRPKGTSHSRVRSHERPTMSDRSEEVAMPKIVASLRCDSLAGDFPIGELTEALYRVIDYLEPRDDQLCFITFPIRKVFREGSTTLHLNIYEEADDE